MIMKCITYTESLCYRGSSNSTIRGVYIIYRLVNRGFKQSKVPFFVNFHEFSVFENKKTTVRLRKDEIKAQTICTAKFDAKSKFICIFKDLAYCVPRRNLI